MSANADLARAHQALAAKQTAQNRLWAYYDGDHPLVYSAARLESVFGHDRARFTQNWCAVVVDAVLDRLNLRRFQVSDDPAATTRLNDLWTHTGLTLDDHEAHRAALVTGEAYVVAWTTPQGEVVAYHNDPRLCHLFDDPQQPNRPEMGCKWWLAPDGRRRLTLYYPDHFRHYVSRGLASTVGGAGAYVPTDPPEAPNPTGRIPMFRLQRERRVRSSELENVIPIQDAINKLVHDMMIAAEFGAFRQRWVISNADVRTLKNAPNEIWSLPAGDGIGQPTQVGEFAGGDLSIYLEAIDRLAHTIGILTRTPRHYFRGQSGHPSGEALIAMEAPLCKKVEHYVECFGAVWREVGAYLLSLAGKAVDPAAIVPLYDAPETVQPRTRAEIRHLNAEAGLPLRTQLRREGWDERQLAALDKDQTNVTVH